MVVLTGKAAETVKRIKEKAEKLGVTHEKIELNENGLVTIWFVQFIMERNRKFLDLTKLYLKLYAASTTDPDLIEVLEITFSEMYKFLKAGIQAQKANKGGEYV